MLIAFSAWGPLFWRSRSAWPRGDSGWESPNPPAPASGRCSSPLTMAGLGLSLILRPTPERAGRGRGVALGEIRHLPRDPGLLCGRPGASRIPADHRHHAVCPAPLGGEPLLAVERRHRGPGGGHLADPFPGPAQGYPSRGRDPAAQGLVARSPVKE